MIVVIRISGMVEMPGDAQEALFRMRLRRKYSAVLLNEDPNTLSLLQKVRNFVAYGPITPKLLEELIAKRAQPLPGKKIDAKKIAPEIGKKDYESLGLKPFFRLHPPRGGIKSKIHYPKGVLGDNKEDINELLGRML